MCAVTSIVDRSVRSIESIDGRYGGCWRRSSPKPPSHKPRRRLNSSSTPGPVDCARAVWRETLSWVPFGAAPPQVTRLSPPTIPSKPPRSSSPGTTMLGQSPLTRAHCGGGGARSLDRARGVWRLRWRWRAVTSPVSHFLPFLLCWTHAAILANPCLCLWLATLSYKQPHTKPQDQQPSRFLGSLKAQCLALCKPSRCFREARSIHLSALLAQVDK